MSFANQKTKGKSPKSPRRRSLAKLCSKDFLRIRFQVSCKCAQFFRPNHLQLRVNQATHTQWIDWTILNYSPRPQCASAPPLAENSWHIFCCLDYAKISPIQWVINTLKHQSARSILFSLSKYSLFCHWRPSWFQTEIWCL